MRTTSQIVPRIQYPNLTGFDDLHYGRNEPAIIVGVPQHHDLNIFKFSPDYLEQALGDLEFPVMENDSGFFSYERDMVKLKFKEFAQLTFRQHDSTSKYYFKNSMKMLPSGLDDSEKISGLARFFNKAVMRNLWISQGTKTVGLHFDAAENLNVQILGRKRFMLYPPGTSEYYPCPMFSQTAHISQVFRHGPELDRDRFPAFDPSKGREVILEQGEILYLPAYWWHQVTSLGDINININTWSLPAVGKQLENWNQALRGHYQLLSRFVALGSITSAPPTLRPPKS
jgi:hypothetical protein